MLYLGCPQWSSTHWKGRFFSSNCAPSNMLSEYGQIFNTVEGNTSFYADPKPDTIQKWYQSVPEDFKFTFKIPRRFSHEMALQHCRDDLNIWLDLFSPLFPKIGQVMLQLPKACSPEYLHRIENFCALLPDELSVAVEVRHLDFFDKGDAERRYNQFLMKHNYNRIMMDTRPLFSEIPNTEAVIDAQAKKPKVPLHVIATSNAPIIRYVGTSNLEENRAFYKPWLNKIRLWLEEGKTPYVFFHTADNYDTPLLARQFIAELGLEHNVSLPFPAEKEAKQNSLF